MLDNITVDNMDSSESENNITIFYPEEATIFAAIWACVFSIVGIAGNSLTTIALLKSPKLRCQATAMFILSLCISDLLFCIINLPLTATRYINQGWYLGDHLCKLFAFMFYGNEAVSLLSMVAITVNRFMLVAYYDKYNDFYTPVKTFIQLALVWLFSCGLMFLPLFEVWGQLGLDQKTFSCTILPKNGSSPKSTLFMFGIGLPCFVIIACYSYIYYVVHWRKRSSGSRLNGQSVKRANEERHMTRMMLIIFICFLICFAPLLIMNVVDGVQINYPWLHIIASVLAWASSVINPIIYAVTNGQYRNAYAKLFKFCCPIPARMTIGSRTQVEQSSDSPN